MDLCYKLLHTYHIWMDVRNESEPKRKPAHTEFN